VPCRHKVCLSIPALLEALIAEDDCNHLDQKARTAVNRFREFVRSTLQDETKDRVIKNKSTMDAVFIIAFLTFLISKTQMNLTKQH